VSFYIGGVDAAPDKIITKAMDMSVPKQLEGGLACARLFLQSPELDPPPPHPKTSVSPPPLVPGGEGHTSLRDRG
jgi:hypothetical protein